MLSKQPTLCQEESSMIQEKGESKNCLKFVVYMSSNHQNFSIFGSTDLYNFFFYMTQQWPKDKFLLTEVV